MTTPAAIVGVGATPYYFRGTSLLVEHEDALVAFLGDLLAINRRLLEDVRARFPDNHGRWARATRANRTAPRRRSSCCSISASWWRCPAPRRSCTTPRARAVSD